MKARRQKQKRAEAIERQAARDARTDAQQIERLRTLRGESRKETARLRARDAGAASR